MKRLSLFACSVLLILTLCAPVLADAALLPDDWWEEALNPEETEQSVPETSEAADTEAPTPDPQGRTPEPESAPASETGCSRRSAVLVALSFGGISVCAGILGYVLGRQFGKRR